MKARFYAFYYLSYANETPVCDIGNYMFNSYAALPGFFLTHIKLRKKAINKNPAAPTKGRLILISRRTPPAIGPTILPKLTNELLNPMVIPCSVVACFDVSEIRAVLCSDIATASIVVKSSMVTNPLASNIKPRLAAAAKKP